MSSLEPISSSSLPVSHTLVIENDHYSIRFCYRAALSSFAIHIIHFLLGPLSLLLMRPIVGPNLLKNMRMGRGLLYLLDLLFHMYLIIAIPLLYFKGARRIEFSIELCYGIAVIFMRNIVLLVKYGTLSKKQWFDLQFSDLSVEDLKTFRIYNWASLAPATAYEEIRYAATRLPVNLSSLDISFLTAVLENSQMEKDSTADNGESKVTGPKLSMSALEAGERIVEIVCTKESKSWVWFCHINAFIFAVMPLLVRLNTFGFASLSARPDEIVFSIATVVGITYLTTYFLRFSVTGVADLQRKEKLMHECMIMSSWCNRAGRLPKVDFRNAESAVGLYYLRRCFFEFGSRYSKRAHLYAALMLPVFVLIVFYIVLQAMKLIKTGYNLVLLPAFYLSIVSDVFLCRMILLAVSINDTFQQQRDLFLEAVARLNQREGHCRMKEDSVKKLLWAERKLEQDLTLRPLKILGVAISQTFVNKLAALAASGVFALIQLNS